MAAKIREIAERVGVSPATVSLVLNMKPGVGAETRDRVLEAAAQLCYRPRKVGGGAGLLARTIRFILVSKRGGASSSGGRVFVADYIDGIEREARQLGCSLVLSSFDQFDSEEVLGYLDEGAVSGAIILSTDLDEADVELLSLSRVPLVFIDTQYASPRFDFVDIDIDACVFETARYLLGLGHERVGFVADRSGSRSFSLRERSLRESLARAGRSLAEADLFAIGSSKEEAQEDASRLASRLGDLPSAFFCVNDAIAYRFIRLLGAAGLSVPEDVSVVGFDNLPSSALMTPSLTTVRVSSEHIGQRAMQLLARRIEAPGRPPEKVLVRGELVVRESAAPPRRR